MLSTAQKSDSVFIADRNFLLRNNAHGDYAVRVSNCEVRVTKCSDKRNDSGLRNHTTYPDRPTPPQFNSSNPRDLAD